MAAREFNFDSIVGPTHNYAGLAFGNLASQKSALSVSSPRHAALEGLAKMKQLADLGIGQGVLAPHDRPDVSALRRVGFVGDDAAVLFAAAKHAPALLAACSSASAMWAANAATVSPSADSDDARVHFTPSNLATQFHRSLETPTTARLLQALFPPAQGFVHHAPLPSTARFADEGAANHTRLAAMGDRGGLQLFVYGHDDQAGTAARPARFPARQTRSASEAIARLHSLDPDRVVFSQQNPLVIDQGVFHNDVICVGNGDVMLYHELAFSPGIVDLLRERFERFCGGELFLLVVKEEELTVAEAVETYLFNSQLVTLPDGSMALIVPIECETHPRARAVVDRIVGGSNPISRAIFVDVRQSMRNGGGPACLRLRVILTADERQACAPGVFLDDALYQALSDWIKRHYRDTLSAADLADPQLAVECRSALEALCSILQLESIYPFQL